MKIFLLYI